MDQHGTEGLSVRMLGAFEVLSNGEPVPDKAWGRKKTKMLLKILLSERGRSFTVDQLVDLLYPETAPEKVLKNLRGRVSQLRKALEPKLQKGPDSVFVHNVGQGYRFNAHAPCWLDTEAFAEHLESAEALTHTDRWPQALERYEQAIALYRGDYLEEDLYEEWTLPLRERFKKQFLSAMEGAARCHGKLGDFAAAIACCQRVIAHEPYRESAFRLMMRCHYHAGQQQQALEAYDACVRSLKDHLGVEPTLETRKLHLQIAKQQVPALQKVAPNTLPAPLTEFVGREDELNALHEHLSAPECRLLTLTGPGGIGKTRLAIQAASAHAENFPDGVFWVPLAALSSEEFLPSAIAEALKFTFFGKAPPQTQLVDYLREKRTLLVLDNFEHLTQASALLNEILSQTTHTKCLVTSRIRLGLQGEWVFGVEGLLLPDQGRLAESDAVRLFVNAARRVRPGFALNASVQADVVEICRLVEGIPLGIELAAAWMETLPCGEIVQEIKNNIDFLAKDYQDTPERHRSVRATFESSWALLSPKERATAAKLSVFKGGFTREAANQVSGTSLRQLSGLINKSFLKRPDGQRYEMHGLLRQFAKEKLGQHPQSEADVKARYVRYFARFLCEQEAALKGSGQKQALQTIAAEIDNVRVAWRWALEQRDPIEQMLESLYLFYEMKGRLLEGEALFKAAITQLDTARPSKRQQRLLAELKACQGRLLYDQGQLDRASKLLQQSVEGFKACPGRGQAFALLNLGIIQDSCGNYEQAKTHLQESLSLYQAEADAYGQAYVHLNLGVLAFDEGDYDLAERCYEKGLAGFRQLEDRFGLAKALNNLGNLYFVTEAYDKAKPYYEECLEAFRHLDIHWGMNIVLNNLGGLSNALGEYDEARGWHEQSMALSRKIGDRTGLAMSTTNLGEVAVNQGCIDEAKRHFTKALALARSTQVVSVMMDVCLFLTQLALKEEQTDWALGALVFFADQHPMRYMREEAQQQLACLEKGLPKKKLAQAKAQADELDINAIVSDVERWLFGRRRD